jgi:hypothetical protein
MSAAAPNVRRLQATVPAQATAGTVQDQVIGTAPFAGVVQAVSIVPEGAVTGNATNFRNFRVLNKGQAGAGSTLVATFSTNATPANDLVAFDEKTVPLSGTPANLVVAAGDVLVADETVGASGVAHTGYTINVDIARTAGA